MKRKKPVCRLRQFPHLHQLNLSSQSKRPLVRNHITKRAEFVPEHREKAFSYRVSEGFERRKVGCQVMSEDVEHVNTELMN
jgi:hypothetical protein